MDDEAKSKQKLLDEIIALRRQVATFEKLREGSETIIEGISTQITGHKRTEMELFLSEPTGQLILIVDDAPINLQILSAVLNKERYRIETAMNGRQALEIVRTVYPDLILLDVLMPEMDGYEVCRILKESPETKDIPVIFITVKDEMEDILKGFEAGAVDYVTKPFSSVELLARVRTHVELKKKRDTEKELIDRLTVTLVERNRAEEELIQANDNLERLVKERTVELTRSNEQLREEIEERKRAEAALKDSEEQYRSLVESTKDSVYLLDADLHYLFVNKTYQKRTGLPLDKIMGRSYADLHPGIHDFFTESVSSVFERDESAQFEYTSFRDGRHFLRTLSPVKDNRGKTIAVTVVSKDISEIKKMQTELIESRERFRALAGRIQKAREDERTEIARDIHDEMGGALSGLKMEASLLEKEVLKKMDASKAGYLLDKTHSMMELIDNTALTMREIIMRLRPGILDDFGLVAAIEWQIGDFSRRTDIRTEFSCDVGDIMFGKDVSTAMFRIFQECLTNVMRHARAKNVTVELREEADGIVLTVTDDGVGISEEKIFGAKSLGLLGMRERTWLFGGNVEIKGKEGEGTTVTISVPLGTAV